MKTIKKDLVRKLISIVFVIFCGNLGTYFCVCGFRILWHLLGRFYAFSICFRSVGVANLRSVGLIVEERGKGSKTGFRVL